VANSIEFKKQVDSALPNLVDITTLGISAANSVDLVLSAYFNPSEIVNLLRHEEVCGEDSTIENSFTQVAQRELIERLGDCKQSEPRQLIQERDQLIQERDQLIQERDQLIQERDQLIQERDQLIQERDQLIQERDQLIQERDQHRERLFVILNSRTWRSLEWYRRIKKSFLGR
jgi:hypothetical protein